MEIDLADLKIINFNEIVVGSNIRSKIKLMKKL